MQEQGPLNSRMPIAIVGVSVFSIACLVIAASVVGWTMWRHSKRAPLIRLIDDLAAGKYPVGSFFPTAYTQNGIIYTGIGDNSDESVVTVTDGVRVALVSIVGDRTTGAMIIDTGSGPTCLYGTVRVPCDGR